VNKTRAVLRLTAQKLRNDAGQDLIEYAFVVALIASAAVAGMASIAARINIVFTNIGTKLSNHLP
jgi:pilus assembly protein Flp/PilA